MLKIDALKPLLSVWLDVAAKSILSLSPSYDRRIWFFLDELASLHRLPSLMNTLSRCRKYGGCFVSVIQDIHKLYALYGREEAQTLTGLFNTQLFFRTTCADTAAWMSRVIGNREIIEQKEGFSYGANDIRDSVSIHQDRRKEPLVMETEFMELDNLQAFLKYAGPWPVTKVKFDIKQRKVVQPALVERKIGETLFFEAVSKIINEEKKERSSLGLINKLFEKEKS